MRALLLAAMPVVLMDGTTPDLNRWLQIEPAIIAAVECRQALPLRVLDGIAPNAPGSWSLTPRSEEHTSELQSRENLVCRLLLEKKKTAHLRNIEPAACSQHTF